VGHSGRINSAYYSIDGKKIISASEDKTIKEWATETGECLRTYQGHTSYIRCAIFSSDEKRILSASDDMTIKEWDIEKAICIRTFHGHSAAVTSVFYSADEFRILSSSDDNAIKEWDIETGESLRTFGNQYTSARSAVYGPDGNRIVAVPWNSSSIGWDLETGKQIKINRNLLSQIYGRQFSANRARIMSNKNNKIVVKNIESALVELTIENIPGLFIQRCTFHDLYKDSHLSTENKKMLILYGADLDQVEAGQWQKKHSEP
jgi:WD40 repeat protein